MSYRNYNPANGFIVAKDNTGDWTNIGAAISAAPAGTTIFLRPGNYVENLTLKAGVNITAWSGDDNEANIIISGKLSFSNAGTVNISNIRLQTNNDYFLEVTGSSASIVNIEGCYLNCNNNTGIHFTSSSSSSQVNIYNSEGDLGTTGICFWSSSSAGNVSCYGSFFTNTGASTTATTNSSGNTLIEFSTFHSPLSTTSTGAIILRFSNIENSAQNTIGLTTNGTGISGGYSTYFASGTASSISIGAGVTFTANNVGINSTNANVITGSGTLLNTGIFCEAAGVALNTSTINGRNLNIGKISFDNGANFLSSFTDWTSFTPTVDGAVSGTTTYTSQKGQYMRIGNLAIVQYEVSYSAATGTGDMILGGLPFTINNSITLAAIGSGILATIAWPASTTQINIQGLNNTTTAKMIATATSNGGALVQMANTNGTLVRGTLIYRI